MKKKSRLISSVLVVLVILSSTPTSMARPLLTKSNEGDVIKALHAGGWKVILGRKINEGRYVDLAEAISDTIAEEDLDPVLDFFTAEVEAQLTELQNQVPEIATEAVRDLLVQAFFTGGQSIRQGRLELDADIARYRRWEEFPYDEQRTHECTWEDPWGIVKTDGFCTTTERMVLEVEVLPEFQPYIRYRLSGPAIPQVPAEVTRLLQELAESSDGAAFAQANLERFNARVLASLKELTVSVEKQVDLTLGAELRRWITAIEQLQTAKTEAERAAASRTLGDTKLQEQLTRLVRMIEAARWLDRPGSSFVLDWAQSNRASKRSEIQSGGWYVVWGVNVNEVEYFKFARALAASVVTVNPGPMLLYFGQYLERTVKTVSRQMPNLTEAALRDLLQRAIESEGQVIRAGNLEVTFDIATYDRWVNWIYDEPRSRACPWEAGPIKTDGFCLSLQRVRRNINMPNHHQPYFRFRWADGRPFDVGQPSPIENRAYYGNASGLYFTNSTGSQLRAAVAYMDPYLEDLVYEGWRVIKPDETAQVIEGVGIGETVYYYLVNDDGFQWQGSMPGWIAPDVDNFHLSRSRASANSNTSVTGGYQQVNYVETVLLEPQTHIRATVTPLRREMLCTVVSHTLNLRRGPGTVYVPPVRSLAQGTQLEPLARNPEGSWIEVQVKTSSDRGWVSANYVSCNQNVSIAGLPVGQIPPVAIIPQKEPTMPNSPAQRPPSVNIVLKHSGKCIRTIDGDLRNIPIQIEQASCRTGYRFVFEQVPGASTYYYIKVAFERGVIGCLGVPDVVKQSFGNGAVKVRACAPTNEFMWRLTPLGGANSGWNLLKTKVDEAFCLGVENYDYYYSHPEVRLEDKRLITVNWCAADDPWQMVSLRP